jgi:hypothetical protein
MNRNMDVVAQGIAAIGPFKLFIAARRQEADEEAARIQPKASALPPAPLWGSGSTAPLPLVTHTEEEEASAEAVPPAAPPRVQTTPMPITPPSPPTGHPSVPPETAPPTTSTSRLVTEDAIPQPPPSEVPPALEGVPVADTSEATVLAEPTTVEAARAQFEATWHMSQPEKLPRVVREAYAERDRAPNEFAQKMIGAGIEGFLPEALEAAVATLIRMDPHFQEADVLSRRSDYAPLFQIELQEEDYHADDSTLRNDAERSEESAADMEERTLPGEADRAALRGDQPF